MPCGSRPGVFVLKGKSLILDGIDLVVDARDLSRTQTALFLCTGTNLTLRNCSITILNHAAELAAELDTRAKHRRRLRVISGSRAAWSAAHFADGFRIDGGPCDVVVRDSVFAAGGGPLVRSNGGDAALEGRIFVVQSLVAGPGPIIESTGERGWRLAQDLW